MNNAPSCSLDSTEMEERLKAWRGVSSRALSREVEEGKITTVYPSDPDLIRRVKELIAAEAGCCSFLNFSLREEDRQTIVELAFPESARSLVEDNLASLPSAPSPTR